MATIEDVKNMIERNEVKNAIAQLDVMIELCPELDELYYLRGNAYRKFNCWKNALHLSPHVFKESGVDIHLLICWTVKRPHCRLSSTTTRIASHRLRCARRSV